MNNKVTSDYYYFCTSKITGIVAIIITTLIIIVIILNFTSFYNPSTNQGFSGALRVDECKLEMDFMFDMEQVSLL
jgi:hypothetical protein